MTPILTYICDFSFTFMWLLPSEMNSSNEFWSGQSVCPKQGDLHHQTWWDTCWWCHGDVICQEGNCVVIFNKCSSSRALFWPDPLSVTDSQAGRPWRRETPWTLAHTSMYSLDLFYLYSCSFYMYSMCTSDITFSIYFIFALLLLLILFFFFSLAC